MRAVATRVVHARRLRWEAWSLERAFDAPETDIWFYVGHAWTRRGAERVLRDFLAAVHR
jgi:hypothetical protein